MKIKFSKVVAIGCAICVAFAGLTAFAANVTTKTTYGYLDDVTTMEVDTVVTGVTAGSEVTYYVSKGDTIVYINQDTATSGSVTFKFNADEAAVLEATARYGTDDTVAANFPTFTFKQGTNFITSGTASATAVEGAWGVAQDYTEFADATDEGTTKNAVGYKAIVSGNYTEYGVKVDGVKYPAAGCDEDGTYMVVLDGITGTEIVPYAE